MEETPKSERKSKFQKSSFKLIFTVAIAIVLVLAVLHWLSSDSYWLQEVRVPNEFEKAGITADTMMNKIKIHINGVADRVINSKSYYTIELLNSKESKINLVETEDGSFESMVNWAAYSLGISRAKKIVVNITSISNKAELLVNIQNQLPMKFYINIDSLDINQATDIIAQSAAESILKISNTVLLAYFYGSITYEMDNRYYDYPDKVIELVRFGLSQKGDTSRNKYLYNAWGLALYQKGRYAEAIEKQNRVIATDLRYSSAYFTIARVLDKAKLYENERNILQKVLTIDQSQTTHEYCYAQIVSSYIAEKKQDAASIIPKDSVKHILLRLYSSATIATEYQMITKHSRDDQQLAKGFTDIAYLYSKARFYDSAIVNDQRALRHFAKLKNDREVAIMYSEIANFFLSAGLYDSAVMNIKKARTFIPKVKNNKDVAKLYNDIAFYYSEHGYYDSAFANTQKAIQADSTFPQTYTTLAEIYGYKKDREKFYFYVEKAFEKGCKTYTQDDIENPVPPYDLYSKEERLKKLWKKYVFIQ